MVSLALSATALVSRMDGWMRSFGADPLTALKSFDFKTVGLVGAGILLVILVIDLIGYAFAAYNGTRRSYVPVSRSVVDLATDTWDNRHSNLIGDYFDPYARSRLVFTLEK